MNEFNFDLSFFFFSYKLETDIQYNPLLLLLEKRKYFKKTIFFWYNFN